MLLIERTPQETRAQIAKWQADGQTIGFVPTMGALHAGHMSLINKAREHCDKVVASIFVNPTQFGAGEDFSVYPRVFDRDYDLLAQHGADLVFLPDIHDIYRENFATSVEVSGITDVLCGAVRPGHFKGVATVVTILLNIIQPQISFFGEKDYQQLQVIRRLHHDLYLFGEIMGVPTLREADGLAMSSRNAYLSPEERKKAAKIYAVLQRIKTNIAHSELEDLLTQGREDLQEIGFSIDYLEVRHAQTLELLQNAIPGSRLLVAARLGGTRLIDNVEL